MAMFANIFAGQYAAMEESGAFEESEIADLQDYLDMLMVQGEYEYEYDGASTCVKIANRILDLFVIPNFLEAILGQELLTGRELDNGERAMKVVVGVLNAVGMRQALSANGIVNVTSVEALSVIGKVAIVNGAADLTAYGVSWIGEELGLPMPVTILLSLVLGITVDYELGCYVFRNGDGSILRRIKAKGAGNAEEIPESGIVVINPNEIRFSQSSVNGSADIVESMKKSGWVGEPIDVVQMPDGGYTTIDNTRVVAARQAGIDVQANIHAYDELLPLEYIDRFTTRQGVPVTWGDAIYLRIGKQNATFRNNNPYGSWDMGNIK